MLKFNEEKKRKSLDGTLALRSSINEVVDERHEKGYDNICLLGIGGTYATALQTEIHMRERSKLDFFVQHAAEYLTTGNKRITDKTLVLVASESGTTEEIVKALKEIRKVGSFVLGFVEKDGDTPISDLTDKVIRFAEGNEQLKFYMVADRLMNLNGEFDDYEEYYKELENHLADAIVDVAYKSDDYARAFAEKHYDDDFHYFVGAGNQYGATYSYAMCYWEEQHWIKTKSIHSAEFFHGMFEIVTRDTNITVYIGEDAQRSLSERVANFLPRVTANYNIIDTKDYDLSGISEKYRGTISHIVMMEINHRIDAYIEKYNRHPMEIRRYYRQLDY